ncbi:hypothetical protein MNBD_ALPHA11-658 [hydrothermal vent metagenome]|uniref:Uncharacterized protein n=1 Tax=hydrothermal vent metagenome TaxID=652676 RepID=A0A3B0TRS3_9ZZZZ
MFTSTCQGYKTVCASVLTHPHLFTSILDMPGAAVIVFDLDFFQKRYAPYKSIDQATGWFLKFSPVSVSLTL